VERLIDKGYAYRIDGDGWYFDIAKDPDYGKLSGRTTEQAEDGVSRIDESVNKKNKGDFCLWKFSAEDEPRWPSALGAGRPGWHIEDTAISEFYFGPQYEIHGGGVDLKFPHHEAEIAQQECASGKKPFVQIWVHTGALLVEGKKMSKSLGNFITIRDFLKKHPAVVLRWLVLSHHYRSPLDYSERARAQATAELENIYMLSLQAREEKKHDTEDPSSIAMAEWKERFNAALDDDLNTPKAIAVIFDMFKDKALTAAAKGALIGIFDGVLGLNIDRVIIQIEAIPPEMTEKFREYQELRSNKQFIQSDALRKEIEGLGYVVRDTADGSSLTKRFF